MTAAERERLERLRHDLRSPLSVIVGFANLLERRDDERFRLDAAARIQEAAETLEQAVDAVLDELGTMFGPESAAHDQLCILVVDDDPVVRELLLATLDTALFRVEVARDADEAIQKLADAPALVILDWRVPGGGGERVLFAAKELDPDRPVVVLTGDNAPATRARVEAGGADVYLTKPFSPLELLATVERLAHQPSAGQTP